MEFAVVGAFSGAFVFPSIAAGAEGEVAGDVVLAVFAVAFVELVGVCEADVFEALCRAADAVNGEKAWLAVGGAELALVHAESLGYFFSADPAGLGA